MMMMDFGITTYLGILRFLVKKNLGIDFIDSNITVTH